MFISFLFVITLLYLPTRLPARRFSIISIIMQLSIFVRRQQSALFVLYALWWETPRTIDKKVAYVRSFFPLVGTSGLEPPTINCRLCVRSFFPASCDAWWEHCELPTMKSLMFGRVATMVGTSGLEPPTSRLSGVCSNRLSYVPVLRYLLLRLAVVSSPFPSGVFYYVWWR